MRWRRRKDDFDITKEFVIEVLPPGSIIGYERHSSSWWTWFIFPKGTDTSVVESRVSDSIDWGLSTPPFSARLARRAALIAARRLYDPPLDT